MESLIIKIVDLVTMIITIRVLFYVKNAKKNSNILIILGCFRISIQITLSYFC